MLPIVTRFMVKLYDIDVLVCITKPRYETYYLELA